MSNESKTVAELITVTEILESQGDLNLRVLELAGDSRQVGAGTLFFASRGERDDGHKYVSQASAQGAVAAIVEEYVPAPLPQVRVADARRAMADISALFFGYPARQLQLIGVTGTNGKTTTCVILEQILAAAGLQPGILGTLNYRWPGHTEKAPNTTPLPITLHRVFRQMVDAGVRAVAMEASSHALSLGRLRGLQFQAAALTNLAADHLDFHLNMENYRASKHSFFTQYRAADAPAILNADDTLGQQLLRELPPAVTWSYGLHSTAQVWAEQIAYTARGMHFLLHSPAFEGEVKSRLYGVHNVYNLLCGITIGLALQLDPATVVAAAEQVAVVPGRLEEVQAGQPFRVVVDYGHTEDGLRKALETLRQLAHSRLICVFGCGGNRDRTKRPRMGATALELADEVIVTSDNPRFEDPLAIIREIEAGMKGHEDRYRTIPDRRQAIQAAIEHAPAGAIVLLAGKGCEDYQLLGSETIHFDDREEAREAIAKRLGSDLATE